MGQVVHPEVRAALANDEAGKRLGDVHCQRSLARLSARAEHEGLAGVVPKRGAENMPVSYTGTAYTLENRRPDAVALVKDLSWMEYSPEGTEERCCYPVRKA